MGSMIGAAVVRKEDPALLTGRGRFVDDIHLPGTLHMAYARSHLAHARIVSIDTSEAAALSGVLGVWTHDDLPGLPPSRSLPGIERPCLAKGKVHFVGEPIAVVVATDPYLAADAAAAVVVDYEQLPVMASLAAATAESATPILDGLPSNLVLEQQLSADDAEAELAAAPHRLAIHLRNQRCAAVPMEPTVCIADWQTGSLTLYATTQTPHHQRNELAQMLGLAQQEVRVIAPDVGGGFGAKASFYPEYLLTAELSRRLRRPVKYLETRSENMTAMVHGRGQEQDIEVGFDDEGHLLALRVKITQDCGGWPDPGGVGLPTLTAFMSGGCYKIPKIAPSFRSVATNTTPVGRIPRRGAARGVVPHRARDRPRGRGAGHRPGSTSAAGTSSSPARCPTPRSSRASSTTRRTSPAPSSRCCATSTRRTAQGPGRPPPGPVGAAAGHRLLHVRRDGRVRPHTAVRAVRLRGWLGVGQRPAQRRRLGRGQGRHQPARAGPPDDVRPDRRRPAARSRSSRSASCTATPPPCRRASARWAAAGRPSAVRRC